MSEIVAWIGRADDFGSAAILEGEVFGERSWGAASVSASLNAPNVHLMLVGKKNKRPLGFVIWRLTPPAAEILSIGIAPNARGNGLARHLLEGLFDEASCFGAIQIFLEVDGGNNPADALYRNLGFCKSAVRRSYYRDGADAIVMRKDL